MAEITKVTVAGVTGAIGQPLVEALAQAGFTVQALTRTGLSDTVQRSLNGIKVIQTDYTNRQQLELALQGQHAVISTLGDTAGAVAAQQALIEASLATGVHRFIPSEFGSDTLHPRVRTFPFFATKLAHQALLHHAATSTHHPNFTYTLLITGPFLDWGLSTVPFILNLGTRNATLYDGGNVPFSTTRVSTLVAALVATLRKPHATANRTLYIHDGIITQNQLLAQATALLPTPTTTTTTTTGDHQQHFTRTLVDTRVLEAEAWEAFHAVQADPLTWIFPFINASLWSRDQLCVFRRTDNRLLGLPELEGVELAGVVEDEVRAALRVFGICGNGGNGGGVCAPLPSLAGEGGVPIDGMPAVDSRTADKAFEEGRAKLAGFVLSS
ncbi:hypothetical protein B0A50_06725 [Salinomyces thailandicus]|uniref:NmrA-like domain-containing protein n=1 Tax=Salinomyces thailandicus TaxID=706561 RepID=A0A4U0TRJ4_9PEZI|nr:hypothetical protein B0A50_06725 [Salinomyces thailandica]